MQLAGTTDCAWPSAVIHRDNAKIRFHCTATSSSRLTKSWQAASSPSGVPSAPARSWTCERACDEHERKISVGPLVGCNDVGRHPLHAAVFGVKAVDEHGGRARVVGGASDVVSLFGKDKVRSSLDLNDRAWP